MLEIKILEKIIDLSPNPTLEFTQIQLSQFYGIEIDDFAHEMAILSLWLAEHQMNKIFEETFAPPIIAVTGFSLSVNTLFTFTISEANNYGDFLIDDYLVTNVKLLNVKDIQSYFKKKKFNSKSKN